MKQQINTIHISGFLIFAVLVFLHSTSVKAQEVEDEREFDYMEGSTKGPEHWGEIKKDWAACKNGGMQSPIDLSSQRVKIILNEGNVKRSYKPCNATVKNRGHDISLQWEGNNAGSLEINGSLYFLQQCHWHSPSEHTLNGRRYAMELHLVHFSPDPNVKNNIAVIGLLYKFGGPDPFLSKLIKNVSTMADQKAQKNMGIIDPSEIKIGGKKYYSYMGSLTVPPCTEGVIWTINKKIRTVSRDQVKLLRHAVHDYAEVNARPLQPLNTREIRLYNPLPGDTS